jgi:hypothetical protein
MWRSRSPPPATSPTPSRARPDPIAPIAQYEKRLGDLLFPIGCFDQSEMAPVLGLD